MSRNLARRVVLGLGAATFLAAAWSSPALSIQALQLYVEGATYDSDSESWLTGSSDITLWVIGNTGHYGPIMDVQLTAAFLTSEAGSGSISITSTNTGLLTDPSTPNSPTLNTEPGVGDDGTIPVMSDGNPLPTQGIYGQGTSFAQWNLGDFTLADSPVGDFMGGWPAEFPQVGQINAYSISISGYSMIHFDVFNHVEAVNSVLFGPFSYDASAVPEPGTYLLLGLGLAGCAVLRRRKRA